MKGYWYDRVQVSIFLCTAELDGAQLRRRPVTAAQQAARSQRQLDALADVKDVLYESRARGLRAGSRSSSTIARSLDDVQAGPTSRRASGCS